MAEASAMTSAAAVAAPSAVLQSHRQLVRQTREHLRVLPASANWYCSKICDWGYSDALGLLLAFGAKGSIFLYQVVLGGTESNFKPPHKTTSDSTSSSNSNSLRFFAHLKRGKKDQRVTALQFLNSKSGDLRLLCGGEEGGVQIWDVATLKLVEQHRKHGSTEVMAVTASASLDPSFVVAGDRQGRISAWKRDEETVAVFTPIAGDGVFAMAMAPHDKALVAVGYRSGVLCIVDALQGDVRYRLDGHDQEVQSIVWKPIASSLSADSNPTNGGAWLASSSKDRSIKVWKIVPDHEPELAQVLTLPKGKQASSYNQSKRLWLPIAWSYEEPSQSNKLKLWSGSFDGNLFVWEWTSATADSNDSSIVKPKLPACKPVVVKNGHSRLLFNIVTLSPSASAGLLPAKAPSMLTISLDRELRIWKEVQTSAALVCHDKLLGLGGHVYSVACNASSQVIACGVGDQTIRLWNVSSKSSSTSLYQADLLWKGLQSKVTCVAWHPFQRSLLGYGTEDGQLGVFDTETKKSVKFKSYHGSQVTVLQWRAKHSQSQSQKEQETTGEGDTSAFVQAMLALESAQAEGQRLEDALKSQDLSTKKDPNELQVLLWSQDLQKAQILESNPEKPDHPSTEINLGAALCTSFAWNARGDRLAVGRENGAVEVFTVAYGGSADFVSILKLHEHEQRVVSLSWNSSTSESTLLAAGSQDGKIIIFELTPSDQKKTRKTSSSALGALNEHVVGVFTGHGNAITSLRWNVTESEADDGGLRTELLASSSTDGTVQVWGVAKHERLSCFRHHAGRVLSVDWVDQFVLVSGGDDQTVRMWDYRDQREVDKATPNGSKSPQQQQHVVADKVAKITTNQNGGSVNLQAVKINGANGEVNSSGTAKKPTKAKKKKAQSVLFHPDAPATLEESLRLCTENLQPTSSLLPSPGSNSVDRFTIEERAYAAEQDWEQLAQVLLLQGNVGDALRLVAKEGVLNPSWLAFAPMAGMDVWREVTSVYAHQLDDQGDKKSAALYFLSLGKARSAIKSLAGGHLFSEALALVESRLGVQDPLFRQTLLEYAAFLEKRERFGEAAQMLLRIGTAAASSRAVTVLVKTGDVRAFETALEICESLKHLTTDPVAQVEDCSIPNRVFLEIISKALSTKSFVLAERAGRWLGTGGIESSASSAALSISTRVTRCFLGIMNEFARLKKLSSMGNGPTPEEDNVQERPAMWTMSVLPSEAQEFFSFLMEHHKHSYSAPLLARVSGEREGDSTTLQSRSERAWHAMLTLCEANGLWFGVSHEEQVLEAQELLMDKNFFTYLAASSPATVDGSLKVIMGVSHCLLQFLLDVVSGYLLSGLERIRDAFEAFSSSGDSGKHYALAGMEFELATLFFPSGFVDPETPPRIGELAIEAEDTAVFWRSFLLFQCRATLSLTRTADGGHLVCDSGSLLANLVGEDLAMRLLLTDAENSESDELNQKLLEQLRATLSTPSTTEAAAQSVRVSADEVDTEEARVE